MTDDEIKAAREACEKATPGPWETNHWRTFGVTAPNSTKTFNEESLHWWGGKFLAETEDEHDSAFIALARTALPAALEEIQQQRSRVAELEDTSCEAGDWLTANCRRMIEMHEGDRQALREKVRTLETELTDCRVRLFEAERQRDGLQFAVDAIPAALETVQRDTAERIAAWISDIWLNLHEHRLQCADAIRSGAWKGDK